MEQPLAIPKAQRLFVVLVLIALAVSAILVVRNARDILLLIWLGIVFAVFLEGAARSIRRLVSLPHAWAVGLALLLLLATAVALLTWLLPPVARDAVQLAEQLPQALDSLENQLRQSDWGREIIARLSSMEQGAGLTRAGAHRFLGIFSSAIGVVTGALIILFLGAYLAFEPDTYTSGLLSLVPASRRERARQVLAELGHGLRWWLGGRLLSMLVVFLLTWLGLALLGIPLPFLLALIAGLLSFIPNIGPVLSAVPAVALALGQGPAAALHVILLYIAIQTVESFTITPLIQRRAAAVPPALLLGFQLLLGVLAGFLGLFAATPLLVAIMISVKMLYIQDRLGEQAPLP
jgi:predicted PurR-regulated permease PerM